MPVRQVQAHEVPRHHLREMRRRSDPHQGASRAHGPHRAGLAGRPHLVPEVAAEPYRPAARHDAEAISSEILYFENYVVTEPGLTPLKQRELLTEDQYLNALEEYGDDSFRAGIGAEAIRDHAAGRSTSTRRSSEPARSSCARPRPRPSARSSSSASSSSRTSSSPVPGRSG